MIRDYVTRPEDFNSEHESGFLNILVRVVSPVAWVYAPCLFLTAVFHHYGLTLILPYSWVILAIYWLIRLLVRFTGRGASVSYVALTLQAIMSLGLALYFDGSILPNVRELGIGALEDSNIGFQILLVSFVALAQWCAVLIASKNGGSIPVRLSDCGDGSISYSSEIERRLFGWRREYYELFSERMKQDPLLQLFFYSVALSEDANRPKGVRVLERITFRFGYAKTTGLMQQGSVGRALTDRESVEAALPEIEKIWDQYLKEIVVDEDDPWLKFGHGWYEYNYRDLSWKTRDCLPYLYGFYCGSGATGIQRLFDCVEQFLFTEYGFSFDCKKITVRYSLLDDEVGLFDGFPVFRSVGGLFLADIGHLCSQMNHFEILCLDTEDNDDFSLAIDFAKENGILRGIEHFPGCYWRVVFLSRKTKKELDAPSCERWILGMKALNYWDEDDCEVFG